MPPQPSPNARPLTAGEIALARGVFGNAIDYATVTVTPDKFMGFHPEGTAMAPDGNLYMHGCYQPDYSALPVYEQSVFIHEMTHVWQFQNKILQPVAEAVKLNLKLKFDYAAAYPYTLDAKKDLLEYNMEQQASIVEDYFTMKAYGFSTGFERCRNILGDNDKIDLYEKVLANFIKDPGYGRNSHFPLFPGKKPKPPAA
ncbi:MAG: hypothetical protein PW788_15350 [Micavibrio sp.]|nr:hypothetical protein [Micavibrio sp.]